MRDWYSGGVQADFSNKTVNKKKYNSHTTIILDLVMFHLEQMILPL